MPQRRLRRLANGCERNKQNERKKRRRQGQKPENRSGRHVRRRRRSSPLHSSQKRLNSIDKLIKQKAWDAARVEHDKHLKQLAVVLASSRHAEAGVVAASKRLNRQQQTIWAAMPADRELTEAPVRPQPRTIENPRLGAGAWLACRTFEPLVRDVDRGTLTQGEWRSGLKRVYDVAKASPQSEVARASEALLRTFTIGGTGGDEEARQQVLALVSACRDWQRREPK